MNLSTGKESKQSLNIREIFLIGSLSILVLNALSATYLKFELITLRTPNLIDGIFLIFCLLSIREIDLTKFVSGLILISLLIVINLVSITNSVPFFESIRATKWILFLVLLIFMQKGLPISNLFLDKLTKVSFSICATKYLIDKIYFGLQYRPHLIYENNYELLFLSVLFLGNYHRNAKSKQRESMLYIFLFLLISFMSLSRWAMICTSLLIFLLIFDSSRQSFKKWKFLVIPFPILSLWATFSLRFQNLQEIDRFKFFQIFLEEIQNKSLIDWLFLPNIKISELTYASCYKLKSYSNLFADSETNSCYSVVLHSFIFRILFDFGPIILILILITFFKLFRALYDTKMAAMALTILILNGLSVSSINTGFGALPFAILILNRSTFQISEKL